MKSTTRTTPLMVALLVAILSGSSMPAAGTEIKKDYLETFDVSKGDRLQLVHGDGDVTITAWDKDQLEVSVKYDVEIKRVGVGKDPDFEVEFKQQGNTVTVIGKEKSMVAVGYVSRERYEYVYTIQAPRYLRLELKGDDGDVEIEGWEGEVECALEDGDVSLAAMNSPRTSLNLEDGDVHVDGLAGDLELKADDGDVHLSNLRQTHCRLEMEDGDLFIRDFSGDLVIRLDDGDVDVLRAETEKADIRAADGNIVLDLLRVDELDLHVATGDGDITVDLPPDLSATFSIDVDDGRIRLDLPGAKIERDEEDSASGTLGDGRGRIRIRSEEGRVTLKQRG